MGGIPKGQLMRIRRNCKNINKCKKQAEVLLKRFVDKGYKEHAIREVEKTVEVMDRKELLKDKPKKNNEYSMVLVADYHRQYKVFENIILIHWPIVFRDHVLAKMLQTKHGFVYRKVPNLRDKLVKKVPDPPKRLGTFLDHKRFYTCGTCKMCRTIKYRSRKTTQFTSFATNKEYKINKLITCQSTHVMYLLTCPCGLQYVGRTTRQLNVRIREHLNNLKKGFKHYSLSQHYRTHHNSDPSRIKVCGIDKIDAHWRGINMTRAVS